MSQNRGCLRCYRLKFKKLLLSNLVLVEGLALFYDISDRRTDGRVTVAAVVVVGLLPSLF